MDPRKHLEATVDDLLTSNLSNVLGTMLATITF